MTAWLTPDDFVADFGEPEVAAMTDAHGTGEIDRPLLERAISRAQSTAESYLAGRYALPLATVPPVVAGAVADLARARLYPRGAPEGVTIAAKAAVQTLEAIAAGRMTLGLPPAAAPAAPPSDAPVLIAPGRRQYPDGLADY